MNIHIPAEVAQVFATFRTNNFDIYLVGGVVRDIMLGRPLYDWDFTTNATPQQILALFPDAFYNNTFGTVGVPNPLGERPFEITTFRTESAYSDKRHPDSVTWGTTIKEDLARRDFTINAIALTIPKGASPTNDGATEVTLIDPFNGKGDLDHNLIRAVGDPVQRFNEDALRMMRAVRIASQLGFTIDETTFEAIKMHASSIAQVSKERVRDELLKLIGSTYPYEGIVMFKNSGLMEQIIPELQASFGVDQKSPGRHHIYDVGTHLIMSLKHCQSPDPIVRLATLIHDIGKPATFRKDASGGITFYNHEVVSAKIARHIAKRLRFSNNQAEKLYLLVRWHMFSVDERQTDSAIRRFIRNVGVDNLNDIVILRIADRLGGGARETSWRLEEFKRRLVSVQQQPFSVQDLKIDGTDVMAVLGIQPGPKVGQILDDLFAKVVANEIENTKEVLMDYLKSLS